MRTIVIVLVFLLSGCQSTVSNLPEISRFASTLPSTTAIPLIVRLRPTTADIQSLGQGNAIKEAASRVVSSLNATPGVSDVFVLEGTSLISVKASLTAAKAIERLPDVSAIFPDYPIYMFLDDAIPRTNLNAFVTPEQTGAGATTVIIDSGVDSGHLFFNGRVIREGCVTRDSSCPNGQRVDLTRGSGAPCRAGNCWHGTHVAGIAAGLNTGGIPRRGAAPNSNIISINVFDAAGSSATSSLREALQLVRDQFMLGNYITAVNMSVGTDPATSLVICNPASYGYQEVAGIIQELKRQGIAVVVASGNDSNKNQISYPACIMEATAVGNSLKNDSAVNTSSDAGVGLDVLAPGTSINSSAPGQTFRSADGTSMAAPLVAGGITALRGGADWDVVTIEDALRQTGVPIVDNGVSYPRVNFQAAQNRLNSARPSTSVVYIKDTPGDLGDQPDTRSANRPLWESPDIWVRNMDDGTANQNLHQHQNPKAGQQNFIYAQARNGGNLTTQGYIVAYYVPAGNAAPSSAEWKELGRSGVFSVFGGGSTIYKVNWPVLVNPGHYCILVKWFPAGATPSLSFSDMPTAVAQDRTLVWRNLNVIDATTGSASFVAQYGFDLSQATNIVVEFDGSAPQGEGWYLEITLPRKMAINLAEETLKYADFTREDPIIIRIPIEQGAVYLRDMISNTTPGNLPIKLTVASKEHSQRRNSSPVTLRMIQIKDVQRHKQKGFESGAGVTYKLDL